MRVAAALLALALIATGGAALGAPKRALVLPPQLNGFIPNRREVERALRVLIENRLKRVRLEVASLAALSLSREESQCTDEACLMRLAEQHGLDVVVAARFINDEQRSLNAYHVWVRVQVRGEPVRTVERACGYCSEDQATDLLAVTVAETLSAEGAPAPVGSSPAPPTPVASPRVASGPPPSPAPSRSIARRLLQGFAIASAIVGVGAFALAGWKASEQGEVSCAPDCRRRDTTAAEAALFTVGAAALAAAVPLAIFGWRRPKGAERRWTVLPSGAGAQLRLTY